MTGFTVIDKTTGEYPDCEKIALKEEWAKHLIYCDIDTFAIDEDGTLILTDDCGNVAYCPPDRFDVSFDNENPWHTGTPTEEGWYLCSTKASDFSVHHYDGNEWDLCPLDFVVAWQKIEPYKEDCYASKKS